LRCDEEVLPSQRKWRERRKFGEAVVVAPSLSMTVEVEEAQPIERKDDSNLSWLIQESSDSMILGVPLHLNRSGYRMSEIW
jgi:hypothetical protein